jgi:RHS repeat-associated protein
MWTWNSAPFGTDAANPNPSGAGTFAYNLRFPGQLFDGQAGLHQNEFRDFDPAIGRYMESDPVGLSASINTYAYVDDDPLGFYDPDGRGKEGGQTLEEMIPPCPATSPRTRRNRSGTKRLLTRKRSSKSRE